MWKYLKTCESAFSTKQKIIRKENGVPKSCFTQYFLGKKDPLKASELKLKYFCF